MSGILTTHSIAQAKRIYKVLKELKQSGKLITGKPLDEKRRLNDPDFPRVAITYSLTENQEGQNIAYEEITEIMSDYNTTFGTKYTDVDLYNQNINNHLERKDAQYKKDGQWLDLVIVVDRLLTGFDAPTIQTLYVDKELRYQSLLQAFSRTNCLYPGKNIGMIVTFRKQHTMRRNVSDAIKLFSNEARNWEQLVPKEYKEVKKSLKKSHKDFVLARQELDKDPNDLKKQIVVIKTFQSMVNTSEAIKSYEDFADDITELTPALETITAEFGHIENLKGEVKKQLEEQDASDEEQEELLNIEFSVNQKPIEETIDSYYINQLLRDINNEESKQKLDKIIESKPEIVRQAYDTALNNRESEQEAVDSVDVHFKSLIAEIIEETADKLRVPVKDLYISFGEYAGGEVPHINIINANSEFNNLPPNIFEREFGEKYRNRSKIIESHWQNVIESKLLPLKGELNG